MESLSFKGSLDFFYMFLVSCLHGEAKHAGIHLVAVGRTVVVNTGDITA